MFLLIILVLSITSDLCQCQRVYSRMMPYDPRYLLHRPPVRRSAMDALERLRMPVTRYFPQVDTQVAPAPYQQHQASLPIYGLSSDDIFALPPQWTDDYVQPPPERSDNDNDYGNYDYEFAPVYRPIPSYADEIYVPQEPVVEPEVPDNAAYNEFMLNYFSGNSEPVDAGTQSEQFDLQRRSALPSSNNYGRHGAIQLSQVLESNKKVNSTQKIDTTPAPAAPVQSQMFPKVQMTAVPAAPEKKELKSLVIPAPIVESRDEAEDPWRTLGQKEEPLFRPLQNSQKTTWEVLTRAKNSVQKRPIPLLKKMIQNGQPQKTVDPLTEELQNLKKEHAV